MSPDEEIEAYNRVVYYLPWVNASERQVPRGWVPKLDPTLKSFLTARALRLYVVLKRLCPDRLLPMLEVVSPAMTKSMMVDAMMNALDAQETPKFFGREAFERYASERRQRFASDIHDNVIDLWRTGGRYPQNNGNCEDFSDIVEELDSAFSDMEAAIAAIMGQAHRTPGLSDEQLVETACDAFVKRMNALPNKAHSLAEYKTWATKMITTSRVPEARRRAASNALGQILAEAEKRWRAEGMSKEQIAEERAEMADTLLDA